MYQVWLRYLSRFLCSAPFKPAANGQAERAVQIIKQGLRCVTQGSLQMCLSRVLLGYRSRPHTVTGRNICAEIRGMQPELLSAVMENAVERARLCEAENGGHLSCIIFHK